MTNFAICILAFLLATDIPELLQAQKDDCVACCMHHPTNLDVNGHIYGTLSYHAA